jgi:BioD-like phosphotransacetylase family protein
MVPHPKILEIIAESKIPVLLANGDTYTVANQVHDLTVKLMPQDKEKIETVIRMVGEFVDIDRMVKEM